MKTALEWKTYYNSPEFLNHYIYEGTDLGAVCTEEGTSFLPWSPSSDKVTLNCTGRGRRQGLSEDSHETGRKRRVELAHRRGTARRVL